jgi:hypothetical protein
LRLQPPNQDGITNLALPIVVSNFRHLRITVSYFGEQEA